MLHDCFEIVLLLIVMRGAAVENRATVAGCRRRSVREVSSVAAMRTSALRKIRHVVPAAREIVISLVLLSGCCYRR